MTKYSWSWWLEWDDATASNTLWPWTWRQHLFRHVDFHLQVMECHYPEDHILNLKTCHLCYHLSILWNDPSTDFVNCVPVNLGYGIPVVYVITDYRNFLTAFRKPLIWYVLTCCIWSSSGLFPYIKSNQRNENIYTLLIMA